MFLGNDYCISGLQRRGSHMANVLDELDETLTNSSKMAGNLGDEFLVYIIDMAVLQVRKKAIHLEDNDEHQFGKAFSTYNTKSEYARSGFAGGAAP
jgi:hypothetical protein